MMAGDPADAGAKLDRFGNRGCGRQRHELVGHVSEGLGDFAAGQGLPVGMVVALGNRRHQLMLGDEQRFETQFLTSGGDSAGLSVASVNSTITPIFIFAKR